MKRIWKCKMNCIMPWRDFAKGETVELDDAEVTPRVKDLFDCMTPEQVKQDEEAKKDDPDFRVMVQRLKEAKIPMKRGISKEEVKKLFDDFLSAQSASVAEAIQ